MNAMSSKSELLTPASPADTFPLRPTRAESLRRMLDDPDWSLPADMARRGRRLLEHIRRFDGLSPDDLPAIGHLDDALRIQLSWSELAGEVQDYLDFRRFCSEGPVRGTAEERRMAWETACLAEANAMLHRQAVQGRGYSRPTPLSAMFRVH